MVPIKNVPKDPTAGIPLLDVREPRKRIEDIVLSDDNSRVLKRILQEFHRAEMLKEYGLRPVSKLLFTGPSGYGKTLAAEVMANELGLPFSVVRMDGVISHSNTETVTNLRRIFEFASSVPMVVLFDKIDIFWKERSILQSMLEIVSFIQMMGDYCGKSLLIAVTRDSLNLSSGVRFDEKFSFSFCDLEMTCRLVDIKLRGVRKDFKIEACNLLTRFSRMSPADVCTILSTAIKIMVINGDKYLTENHILSAIR